MQATLDMMKKDEEKKKKEKYRQTKKNNKKKKRRQQYDKEQAQKEKEAAQKAKQAENNPFSVIADKDEEEVMDDDSVVFTEPSHIVKYHDVFFKFDNGPYRTMLSAVMALCL